MLSLLGDAARQHENPTEAVLAVMSEIMPHIGAFSQTRYWAVLRSIDAVGTAGGSAAISAMATALNASGRSKQVSAREVSSFIRDGIHLTRDNSAPESREAARLIQQWESVVEALVSAHPHLFLARQNVLPRPQLGEKDFFATDPQAGLTDMAAFIAADLASLGSYEKDGTVTWQGRSAGGFPEYILEGTGERIKAMWSMAAKMPTEIKKQVAEQLNGYSETKYMRVDYQTKSEIASHLTPRPA